MKLTKLEIAFILTLLTLSFIGFMIKLPSVFRRYDSELHFLFYLLTAIFFYMNFGKDKITYHVVIFMVLLMFGIGIEVMQELSNHILNRRIHGNFDPKDVFYNVFGLVVATLFWTGSSLVKKLINN